MVADVQLEDPRWEACDLEAIAEAAAAAVCIWAGLDPDLVEVAVLGCDDARIAELNGDFRDKPQPTNVLSWPEEELGADQPGGKPYSPSPDHDGQYALGDIAIAWETCEREALEAGKPIKDHATHLVVHAMLHLLGYDHVQDADGDLMEAIEVEILWKLGIANPYAD
ncbi:rRNA maturation RNase YbeY [Chachezhania sediminis]|uniref:rRNA maturation RNase YbeY n=1 Tax=Chachezhania sediminis TaxID=2599291 RepID=UPI00131EAA84|nr:rRNA maturation RNase YbeY [Chachezhania sediminis]